MRELIIADNQDISKAGMMFPPSRQKDVSFLLEADRILFSDELSLRFLRQRLFSSIAFGVVMTDNYQEKLSRKEEKRSRRFDTIFSIFDLDH